MLRQSSHSPLSCACNKSFGSGLWSHLQNKRKGNDSKEKLTAGGSDTAVLRLVLLCTSPTGNRHSPRRANSELQLNCLLAKHLDLPVAKILDALEPILGWGNLDLEQVWAFLVGAQDAHTPDDPSQLDQLLDCTALSHGPAGLN